MGSVFIGEKNLELYNLYTRVDVGYARTRRELMRINNNEQEKIGFFYLDSKYNNKLTKEGFLWDPRENNQVTIDDLNRCKTYLFLRKGKEGPYYYIGYSDCVERRSEKHILFRLHVSPKKMPTDIIKNLG